MRRRRIPYNEDTTREQTIEMLSRSPTLIVLNPSPSHSPPNAPELAMLPPPAMQPPPHTIPMSASMRDYTREELIEELRDFDVWKTFKHDENFLESRSIDIVKGWYKDI